MRYVIAYDISDNKRRTKLVKRLESVADRVQFSVFEADLSAKEYQSLLAQLTDIIDPEKDTVRIYRLCADCAETMRILGQGRVVDPPGVIIV